MGVRRNSGMARRGDGSRQTRNRRAPPEGAAGGGGEQASAAAACRAGGEERKRRARRALEETVTEIKRQHWAHVVSEDGSTIKLRRHGIFKGTEWTVMGHKDASVEVTEA